MLGLKGNLRSVCSAFAYLDKDELLSVINNCRWSNSDGDRILTLERQGFTHPHLWIMPNAGQVCSPSTVVDDVHMVLMLGGLSTIVDVQY